MNDKWNWDYAWESLPLIVDGLVVTLQATVLGSILAYVLGLIFALIRRARIPVLHTVVWLIIEFVRSTPLLVQLFFIFYVAPVTFGVTLSPLTAGVIGLGLHYACYTAEVYRAGIEGVPKGQWEAATALSLPPVRTWQGVILPQAIPRVLPALGNYTISMLKESPLLFGITVLEMVGAAFEFGSFNFRYLEPLTIVGILFLIVSYAASLLVRYLERRFGLVPAAK